jgi:benzoylformate decarboxylase
MNCGDLVVALLQELGVEHVFGNPGSTEAPLMQALAAAEEPPHYVLGLQEATVVGMADGYASVTGRPAFINLHTAAGVGNAMGGITNARANLAPMVVTAGQQDRRHLISDPFLGGDLVGLASSSVKWARQVERSGDLEVVLRRAFHDALVPPAGPVFVSLPMDLLDEEIAQPPARLPAMTRGSGPAKVDELAGLLLETPPGKLLIVAGDEVADARAGELLVQLAEALASPVYGGSLHARGVFPPAHPLWKGPMPATAAGIRRILSEYERVLLLGGQVLLLYTYADGSPIPPGVDILQISPDPSQLGRTWPLRWGGHGEMRATLENLVGRVHGHVPDEALRRAILEQREKARHEEISRRDSTALGRYSTHPTHPMAAVHAVLKAIPEDTLVVDEAVSAGAYVRGFHRPQRSGRYYFCRGGGLGWGMPAAVGVSVGSGREKVVCFVGDGAAAYSPQALWTAAHERVPVVFVIIDNGGYGILREGLRKRISGIEVNQPVPWPGCDIRAPSVDFAALASAFGVDYQSAAKLDEVPAIVEEAMNAELPQVVRIPIGDAG